MKRIEYGSIKHSKDYKYGNGGFPRHIINSLDMKRLPMKFHPYNRKLRTDWNSAWCWVMPSGYITNLIFKYVGRPYSELCSYLDKVLKNSKVPSQYNADYFLSFELANRKAYVSQNGLLVNDEGIIERVEVKKRSKSSHRPWRRSFILWNNSQKVLFPPKDSTYLQHRQNRSSMAWKIRKGEYKWYLGTFWCKIDNKFYKLPVYDVIGLISHYVVPRVKYWWESSEKKPERIKSIEELYIIPYIACPDNSFAEHIYKEIPNPKYPEESEKEFITIDIGVGQMYPVVLREDYEKAKNSNLGK